MFQTNPGVGNLAAEAAPDVCPQCHHAVHPIVGRSTLTGPPTDSQSVLEVGFQCTRKQCARMFIGRYQRKQIDQTGLAVGVYSLTEVEPKNYLKPNVPQEVIDISPMFMEIFSQSSSAETQGLDQICGVGYRKALEFLIKDFCISRNPGAEEEIKKKFLGAVIQDHVHDANIKACAERAVWLGNDETHYLRKWGAKDINDLKTLIELACVWIRSDVLTKMYLEDMERR